MSRKNQKKEKGEDTVPTLAPNPTKSFQLILAAASAFLSVFASSSEADPPNAICGNN